MLRTKVKKDFLSQRPFAASQLRAQVGFQGRAVLNI